MYRACTATRFACSSDDAIVFQDPFSSLNPRFSIGRTVANHCSSTAFVRREIPKSVAKLWKWWVAAGVRASLSA